MTDAIKNLEALIEGVNPTTGELLPDSTLLSDPIVLRTLIRILRKLETDPPKKPQPLNAGSSWSQQEEQMVVDAFKSGSSISEISSEHGRSDGAIHRRLEVLKVIPTGVRVKTWDDLVEKLNGEAGS